MTACAALGLRAAYLGPVGNDENGARVRSELSARGVDVARLIVRTADTRYAVILVDERSGERQVLWHRDPRLSLEDAEVSAELFAGAQVLHVDAVDEAASIKAAVIAKAQGLIVTSDIDTVTTRTPELLAAVTVAIVAEHVPAQLTGRQTSSAPCVPCGRATTACCASRWETAGPPRSTATNTTSSRPCRSSPSIRPAPGTSSAPA